MADPNLSHRRQTVFAYPVFIGLADVGDQPRRTQPVMGYPPTEATPHL